MGYTMSGSSGAYGPYASQPMMGSPANLPANVTGTGAAPAGSDLTGQYLGAGGAQSDKRIPRVIPNPFDNTLLVQATPQEWESISKLLAQLDVPPRQVLIEAKVYEVDLKGAFSAGVSAYLQRKGASDAKDSATASLSRTLLGTASTSGLSLTSGLLVGRSRELLGVLSASENASYSKVISEPSVIATDSIGAFITVGQEVPTLTSQALAGGVQSGGSSLFTNTVSSRNTGITLSVTARVNSSGIVTLAVQQEISDPIAPSSSSAIQSPSFSKRTVATQLTVQDGDTVAIGGSIQESDGNSSSGVPFLHRVPVLGALFGEKSISKARTELVVFFTPHVIYDTNQLADATDELMSKLKRIRKIVKED
jgi:general secretion pathway protein D